MKILLLVVILVQLCVCSAVQPSRSDVKNLVDKLYQKVLDSQVKKSAKFFPPFSWIKQKGVWESDVMLNLHGDFAFTILRDSFRIFDNNMFATSWITTCLIEAHKYGIAPKPDEATVTMALESINEYSNHNVPYNNSQMNFWPQVYNSTLKIWQSTPENLLDLFKLTDYFPGKTIEEILTFLGQKKVADTIKSLLADRAMFEDAFHIPSDFDDTFVNVGLGSLLASAKSELPSAFTTWQQHNTNLSSVIDAVTRYAYKPFSNDQRVNTIDPRTYYYMREFLEKAGGTDLALVPTWIQDTNEVRVLYAKGVAMPFNVNNVDCTVAANTIFGITSAVINGLLQGNIFSDVALQKVYLDTAAMIAFQIEHDFGGRVDLALTYYPSLFEFYWFVARTYNMLESQDFSSLPSELQQVYHMFKPVLKDHATTRVIKSAVLEDVDLLYFDDFLGDDDRSIFNKSKNDAEDRIFTTTMALNTLLTTWTVQAKDNTTLSWQKDKPANVITTVDKGINWLLRYALSDQYKPWNAFFSGSVKSLSDLPFFYPINRIEYFNGTRIPSFEHIPQDTIGDIVFGVEGFISEEKYQEMVKKIPTKERPSPEFAGFNKKGEYFPFWSSTPYTHATTMLVLAKYANIA
ncbi:hypothetical protein SNE40_021702 [Patella caerulea]|uniref:Uncharacterized protein n=1 Tax=Patella caerulea TaxID=87958 RepID=A0AAN8GCV6_PATCE